MGKGALVFKGDKPKSKKKKKRSKHGDTSSSGAPSDERHVGSPSASAAAVLGPSYASSTSAATPRTAAATAATATTAQPQIEDGIGRISTSGTVVNGQGTRLLKSLRAGDAILVNIGGKEEMRVLTMVLSDVSAALSTPFSCDVKIPVEFRYIQKPRNVVKERADAAKKVKVTKEEEERSAFGLYGTGTEFVYRETTEHGSYRIKREKVDGNVTRGDLLERRTKKKSDKYC
mmetsp:Transcript_34675/g.75891  ORF Transcript_34675/g.75891 Transcript_34675/m.75891 type:complete len:231 (-) Transcript_34675:300-992(-)